MAQIHRSQLSLRGSYDAVLGRSSTACWIRPSLLGLCSWAPVLLLLCLTLGLAASESGAPSLMRWRVFADPDSRISFRFPFHYRIPDLYHPGLTRGRVRRQASLTAGEAAMSSPEQARALLQARLRDPQQSRILYDLELAFIPRDKLTSEQGSRPLQEVAARIAGFSGMVWKDYDYYAVSDDRPHAAAAWAPRSIQALLGQSEEHSALLLRYEQGLAILRASGGLDAHENRKIFDTVEVMVERGRGRNAELFTYRHHQSMNGMLINAQDRLIQAPQSSQSLAMHEAWQIETANDHIISNVSPQHLQRYASMMEVLFDAYSRTYTPDRLPPFKMEVAVWNNHQEMAQAAGAIGIGQIPRTTLGFFSPSLVNIMAFETQRRPGDNDTFSVLAHEASHQFLHLACSGSAHVPTWINEGLAVYFESTRYNNGRLQIQVPRQRLDLLLRHYRAQGRMLTPPGQYLNHYGPIPGPQYGEVYLKTHFWLFGVPGGRERFLRYWQALRNGEDGTQAFDRIFMQDLTRRFGSRDAALAEVEQMIVRYAETIR